MMWLDNLIAIYEPNVWKTRDPKHVKILCVSTACYGNSFNSNMWMMFIPQKKYTYVSPRPVTGIALLFDM
jgi:hypothetical protein